MIERGPIQSLNHTHKFHFDNEYDTHTRSENYEESGDGHARVGFAHHLALVIACFIYIIVREKKSKWPHVLFTYLPPRVGTWWSRCWIHGALSRTKTCAPRPRLASGWASTRSRRSRPRPEFRRWSSAIFDPCSKTRGCGRPGKSRWCRPQNAAHLVGSLSARKRGGESETRAPCWEEKKILKTFKSVQCVKIQAVHCACCRRLQTEFLGVDHHYFAGREKKSSIQLTESKVVHMIVHFG